MAIVVPKNYAELVGRLQERRTYMAVPREGKKPSQNLLLSGAAGHWSSGDEKRDWVYSPQFRVAGPPEDVATFLGKVWDVTDVRQWFSAENTAEDSKATIKWYGSEGEPSKHSARELYLEELADLKALKEAKKLKSGTTAKLSDLKKLYEAWKAGGRKAYKADTTKKVGKKASASVKSLESRIRAAAEIGKVVVVTDIKPNGAGVHAEKAPGTKSSRIRFSQEPDDQLLYNMVIAAPSVRRDYDPYRPAGPVRTALGLLGFSESKIAETIAGMQRPTYALLAPAAAPALPASPRGSARGASPRGRSPAGVASAAASRPTLRPFRRA